MQAWEGMVLEVRDTAFLARLRDLTHPGPDEEALFPLTVLADEDQARLTPGALFDWDIGCGVSDSEDSMPISRIRFRRVPVWTQQEIDAAQREANRLGHVLGWYYDRRSVGYGA